MNLRDKGRGARGRVASPLGGVAGRLSRHGRGLGPCVCRRAEARLGRGAARVRSRREGQDGHACRRRRRDGGLRRATRRRCSAARPTSSSRRRRTSTARASSRRCSPGATSPSASASTRWARSSTAWPSTAASSSPTARPSSSSATTCGRAVRLSALMGLPVLWVWTHDSVGLGEDGPTHQPVEHYMALRAIPNFWFFRPADANETTFAWRVALEREDGPVGLLLSRQNMPVLDRDGARRRGRGASAAATCCGTRNGAATPELILIATGAEVWRRRSRRRSSWRRRASRTRVVSMPCMELFEEQGEDYRERCSRRRRGAPRRRAGVGLELVAVGREGGRRRSAGAVRRLGAGHDGAREARLHTGEHRHARPGAPAQAAARRLRKGRTWLEKSKLHKLSELGQSIWIDFLSRDMIRGGQLREMIEAGRRRRRHVQSDDLPEGDLGRRRLRRAAARGARGRSATRRRSSCALAVQDVSEALDLLAACVGRGLRQATDTSRSRSTRTSPTTREGTTAEADAPAQARRQAEPLREDPGDEAGPARDRGHDREGQVDQRHADLLARALRGGRARPTSAAWSGSSPGAATPARSHPWPASSSAVSTPRPTSASTRPAGTRSSRGSSRSPTPSSPTSATRSSSPARPGTSCLQGRDAAAAPVGLDVHEEPRVPRRHVRRGADRAGDCEHDARGDDPGLPGPREGRAHAWSRGSTRRSSSSSTSRRRASTTTT